MRPLGLAMSLKISALSSLEVFLVMLKGISKNEANKMCGAAEEMVGIEVDLAAGRPRRRSSSTCERK